MELQRIKINLRESEETYCYSANLCLDNVTVAEVSNEGRGGADSVTWLVPSAGARVWEYLRSLPPVELSPDDAIPMTLEIWCGERLNDHLIISEARRNAAKAGKMIFGVTSETEAGKYSVWNVPPTPENVKVAAASLRRRGLSFFIINSRFILDNPSDWLEKAHKMVEVWKT
jgi:hypothetical protein